MDCLKLNFELETTDSTMEHIWCQISMFHLMTNGNIIILHCQPKQRTRIYCMICTHTQCFIDVHESFGVNWVCYSVVISWVEYTLRDCVGRDFWIFFTGSICSMPPYGVLWKPILAWCWMCPLSACKYALALRYPPIPSYPQNTVQMLTGLPQD